MKISNFLFSSSFCHSCYHHSKENSISIFSVLQVRKCARSKIGTITLCFFSYTYIYAATSLEQNIEQNKKLFLRGCIFESARKWKWKWRVYNFHKFSNGKKWETGWRTWCSYIYFFNQQQQQKTNINMHEITNKTTENMGELKLSLIPKYNHLQEILVMIDGC